MDGNEIQAPILIFGGTSEGRTLAELCALHGIAADVCVVSQIGDEMMTRREGLRVIVGALDAEQMIRLMQDGPRSGAQEQGGADTAQRCRPAPAPAYRLAIDATHPYAREATKNIRCACSVTQIPYLRVKRESEPVSGTAFDTLDAMIDFLNRQEDAQTAILSTLGGTSLESLTRIRNYRQRVWARVLPSAEVMEKAVNLGYPAAHIMMGKGPFDVRQNVSHLRRSGAAFLLTKESGKVGGYPEKVRAAEECGVQILTLRRAREEGVTLAEAAERMLAAGKNPACR